MSPEFNKTPDRLRQRGLEVEALDQQQHDAETAQEEYEAEQEAMPPHKRDGYAERMAEMADMRRKEIRENGQ